MSIENWFHTSVKGHVHVWGKWILLDTKNIKFNHRMVQGQKHVLQRTCETCGEVQTDCYERKLDI